MQIAVKTQAEIEPLLAEELKSLGLKNVETGNRLVYCEGEMEHLYRINYESRLALKVLVPITQFEIKDAKDLYTQAMETNWNEWLTSGQTFVVRFSIYSPFFSNTLYGAQLFKDAIVDTIRKKTGKRPNVDLKNPDIVFDLHINGNSCVISADSSGEPLFKRNYKTKSFKAPLNEILAAAMIQISGWDKKQAFINPMCGSGTLLFEALFYAENRPSQFYRKDWTFQNWKDYDKDLFEEIKEKADAGITYPSARIIGIDQDAIAIRKLRKTLKELGHDDKVSTQMTDFFDWKHRGEDDILVINPPYDERMKLENVQQFYQSIGDYLKNNFQGNTAWILTSNKTAMKSIGLKTSARKILFNGPLECRFLKYELFSGSLKPS